MSAGVSGSSVFKPGSHTWLRTWRFSSALESWSVRHRAAITAGLIFFYAMSFNGLWRVGPDSALYLAIARNIANGRGYTYMGEVNRLAYPGLPYVMAWLMKATGNHAIAIASALMVACTLGIVALSEKLFRLMVRPATAFVCATFVACNYLLHSQTFELLTDIPFVLATMLVLLGGAYAGIMPAPRLDEDAQTPTPGQRRLGWVMLPAGLAMAAVFRPTFYALALCVGAASVVTAIQLRKVRHLLAAAGVIGAIGAIVALVALHDPRRSAGAADIYEMAVGCLLSQAMQNWSVPLKNAILMVKPELPTAFFGFSMTWFDPVLSTMVLAAAAAVLWRYPAGLLWIALTLGMQLVVEPVPRYMAPILPLLVLSWWVAASRMGPRWPAPPANVVAIVAYVMLLPGFVRCFGQTWMEQYQRPFLSHYHHGSYEPLEEMTRLAKSQLPADAILVTPKKGERIANYLAQRQSYSVDQPLPDDWQRHPVYAFYPPFDAEEAAQFDARFVMGEPLANANGSTRRVFQLQLRPITGMK